MHSPDYLLHVSEGAEELAEQLHNEIIKRIVDRIMLRIGRGDNYLLTAQDKWQIETLQEAGYLLEDIHKEIAKSTKLQQEEIAEAMEEANVENSDTETEETIYPEFVVGKWYYTGDRITFYGNNYICVAPDGVPCVWGSG